MADLQLLDCPQPDLVKLERVHYFPRQLLTVADMTTDQNYFLEKLRRHNRFLHGWGVVCGLEVIAAPITHASRRLRFASSTSRKRNVLRRSTIFRSASAIHGLQPDKSSGALVNRDSIPRVQQ